MTIKYEAGRAYKTRGGGKAFIECIDHERDPKHPYRGYEYRGQVAKTALGITWCIDGRFMDGEESQLDLVDYWEEEPITSVQRARNALQGRKQEERNKAKSIPMVRNYKYGDYVVSCEFVEWILTACGAGGGDLIIEVTSKHGRNKIIRTACELETFMDMNITYLEPYIRHCIDVFNGDYDEIIE